MTTNGAFIYVDKVDQFLDNWIEIINRIHYG
eukprot:CAMPEP_0170823248 /NCGR_PEP_ID=MMETSP0733-20121128/44407_1 /TAXON_ID=186038 /ORGANISM="Fragilariopsis kerguelensis, Strain L26-C5" /LENGTH=30 /DNA_ID= /DNA_START= /DNA_END= /DNA_ORIENTATION=